MPKLLARNKMVLTQFFNLFEEKLRESKAKLTIEGFQLIERYITVISRGDCNEDDRLYFVAVLNDPKFPKGVIVFN